MLSPTTLRIAHSLSLLVMVFGVADLLMGVVVEKSLMPLYFGAIPAILGFLLHFFTGPRRPTI